VRLHYSLIEILKTERFTHWFDELRGMRARARIQARIDRLSQGNAGDAAAVGEGVSEMRIHYGPGYRVYFKKHSRDVIILLAGGDKRTQSTDILAALRLAQNL